MATLMPVVIYAFGFVGLAAITLIPLRAWLLLRPSAIRPLWLSSSTAKALCLSLGVLFAFALGIEFKLVARLFHCLTEAYCGPSRAGGWLTLAALGVVYLAVEVLLFVWSAVARRTTRCAA